VTEFVKIRHPEAGEAMVPESSVSHHRGAGWELAEILDEQQKQPADAGAQESVPASRRRRGAAADTQKEQG
jgi:hypothetical protein